MFVNELIKTKFVIKNKYRIRNYGITVVILH